MMQRITTAIDSYFCLTERKSTIRNEIMGGTTTFLTMSYIIVVNPKTLLIMGVPTNDGVIGTAIAAAVGCFVTGIFANLPFGLCPGLGLTSYVAYGMVLSGMMTLSQAFTACFIGGLLLAGCAMLGIIKYLLACIPRSVRLATIVGMGLQIALAGMESVNILVPRDRIILGLGPLENFHVWLTFFGLILIAALVQRQVPGGILIGIVVLTIITWIVEDSYPSGVVSFPSRQLSSSDLINFSGLSASKIIAPILTFLVVGVVDVGGCALGLGAIAGLLESDINTNNTDAVDERQSELDDIEANDSASQTGLDQLDTRPATHKQPSNGSDITAIKPGMVNDKSGDNDASKVVVDESNSNAGVHVPGTLAVFIGCGVSTMIGACLGTSPTILVVESAVGIKVGARTGLSACVVGFWFILSLFFIPVLSHIPSTATAPVSILLGVMMMSQVLLIDWNCLEDAVPAFLTVTMIPLTFSIANGIIIGIIAALLMKSFTAEDIVSSFADHVARFAHEFRVFGGFEMTGPDGSDNFRAGNVDIVKSGISKSIDDSVRSDHSHFSSASRGSRASHVSRASRVSRASNVSRASRAQAASALNAYAVFGNHLHSSAKQANAEKQLHLSLADIGLIGPAASSMSTQSFPFMSLAGSVGHAHADEDICLTTRCSAFADMDEVGEFCDDCHGDYYDDQQFPIRNRRGVSRSPLKDVALEARPETSLVRGANVMRSVSIDSITSRCGVGVDNIVPLHGASYDSAEN